MAYGYRARRISAFRRRTAARRIARFMRRRRRYARVPRRPRRGAQQVNKFFRTCAAAATLNLTANAPSPGGGGWLATGYGLPAIMFNQIAGESEFAALYDQYKILKVYYRFRFDTGPVPAAGFEPAKYPWFKIYNDYDDNSTPTDSQIREVTRAKEKRFTPTRLTHGWTVRPRVAGEVYRSVTSTAYAVRKAPWLDMGIRDVPHYGTKIVIYVPQGAEPSQITVEWRIKFLCRGVR